ncbi:MAG TPA: AmmeMemoRadiSam system protein A, partial [Phycisphaerae bacterium]|nr:AmmeMemoRadiSam system protein A [Phycisphaerae bacterium]
MTSEQRKAVLDIARRAVEAALRGSDVRISSVVELPEAFSGAFVTLKHGPRLRGCMGTFRPLGDLAETIDSVARTSCLEDPRFAQQRITLDELNDLTIEISVLDQPERTDDPAGLEVGRHGVLIRRGTASGCLLPQVAVERGWSAEEFLSQCCSGKAGLDADA